MNHGEKDQLSAVSRAKACSSYVAIESVKKS